jgi:hypothetical protein
VGSEPTPRAERQSALVAPTRESSGGVDQLFARMRADRADSVGKARDVLAAEPRTAEAPAEAVTVTDRPEVSSPSPTGDRGEIDAAVVAGEAVRRGTDSSVGGEAQEAVDGRVDDSDDHPRSDIDEQLLQRRDDIVERLGTPLVRKIKRSLQDEQNVALDRLRTHKGRLTADVILRPLSDHLQAYVGLTGPVLYEVERAGAKLAGELGPVSEGTTADQAALAALATSLGSTILEPIRSRIERSIDEAGDDAVSAADGVSVAFREWRSSRIESLVSDQVTAAMTFGLRRVLRPGTMVRWIVDDGDGRCPDCDDNALAGPTPVGEAFPTGQLGPPAHPGCRCLLVPAST